jgi:hypothetical protein
MSGSSTTPAPLAPRKRVAKGPRRPQYLENPELDKFMMMMTAMLSEISSLRDRLDTHEALAKRGHAIVPDAVEVYRPTPEERALRERRRDAMLSRVFRILLEELEEAQTALGAADLETVLAEDGETLSDPERVNT